MFHRFGSVQREHDLMHTKKGHLELRFADVKRASDMALSIPDSVLEKDEGFRAKRDAILNERNGLEAAIREASEELAAINHELNSLREQLRGQLAVQAAMNE